MKFSTLNPQPGYRAIPAYRPTPGNPPSSGYPHNSGYSIYPPMPNLSACQSHSSDPPAAPEYPPTTGYPPTTSVYPPTTYGYPPAAASAPEYPVTSGYPSAPHYDMTTSSAAGIPMTTGCSTSSGLQDGLTNGQVCGQKLDRRASDTTSSYESSSAEGHYAVDQPTIMCLRKFDPSKDASVLKKATNIIPDVASIINILANRTNEQRRIIISSYSRDFGKDWLEKLEKKITIESAFKRAVRAIMTPTAVLLASHLYDAINGPATNVLILIEIMCTRNSAEIQEINSVYHHLYGRPLENDLEANTSGHVRRLLISMTPGALDEMDHNLSLAPKLAQKLRRAVESSDKVKFNKILSSCSFPVLRSVLEEYEEVKGKSLLDAINSEFSEDIEPGLQAVVMCIENQDEFLAICLHGAITAQGAKDDTLIRIIVTRAEIDLGNIKQEYQRRYRRTLGSDI
ncbi:annexin B9-like [Hyalella azteca]|uniref:Annexin B9-like n=1 Tax=Hyalella azteca TaxID=294128 RepID=A0A979FXV7_HYAAZ|nr:annexin B9-like [Hyalella azteca]